MTDDQTENEIKDTEEDEDDDDDDGVVAAKKSCCFEKKSFGKRKIGKKDSINLCLDQELEIFSETILGNHQTGKDREH